MNAEIPRLSLDSIGDRHQHKHIAVGTVSRERFRAVQNIVVSITHGSGLRSTGVTASFRFGQSPGAQNTLRLPVWEGIWLFALPFRK